jgi:hypothetical protein
MANLSKTTRDHEEIRRWAEERGGKPAHVKSTGSEEDIGILRIDFPGYSGEGSLEPISWGQFFEKFDERGLALLYQEETAGGERSNFNKLVTAETAEESESRGGGEGESRGRRSRSSKSRSAKKSTSKKAASTRRSSGGAKKAAKGAGKKSSGKKSGAKKGTSRKGTAKRSSSQGSVRKSSGRKKTAAKKGSSSSRRRSR